MKNLMRLCATAFVSIFLISCVGAPKAPQGWVKTINAKPTTEPQAYARWYNFETDFNPDFTLKDGVEGVKRPITLDDLHANYCMDAPSTVNLKAYALKWRERYLYLERQLKECEAQR